MVKLVRHPQTKGRETDRLHLSHRATSRLYPKLRFSLKTLLIAVAAMATLLAFFSAPTVRAKQFAGLVESED